MTDSYEMEYTRQSEMGQYCGAAHPFFAFCMKTLLYTVIVDTYSGSFNIFFHEIHKEIFSIVILFFSLIQEGTLSVSGKRMCRSTG